MGTAGNDSVLEPRFACDSDTGHVQSYAAADVRLGYIYTLRKDTKGSLYMLAKAKRKVYLYNWPHVIC